MGIEARIGGPAGPAPSRHGACNQLSGPGHFDWDLEGGEKGSWYGR
jgi:hypothetical protein